MSTKKTTSSAPRRASATNPDLADLLAAVLTHPDLPNHLWERIIDAVTEFNCNVTVYHDPAVLRAVIAYNTRRRSKGGVR